MAPSAITPRSGSGGAGMTGSEHSQVRRAIQACRYAGLPVVHPDDCTCSLSGRLVVLARPDGLKVVWPYEQRCPIHGPRDRDDTDRCAPLARARRPPDGRGHNGTRASDEPSRPRSRPEAGGPARRPVQPGRHPRPTAQRSPAATAARERSAVVGSCTPTASPPSTASTPPRSTSRSPSTAPRCSVLGRPARSGPAGPLANPPRVHRLPDHRRGTPAARRRDRRAHPPVRRCAGRPPAGPRSKPATPTSIELAINQPATHEEELSMGTTLIPPFATAGTDTETDRRWRHLPRQTASACAEQR